MNLNALAQKLNLPLETVEKQTVKDFLERKLLEVETELFLLASKYGVNSIKEFDRLIKSGKIKENHDTRDDFFRIDHLESERDLLKNLKRP